MAGVLTAGVATAEGATVGVDNADHFAGVGYNALPGESNDVTVQQIDRQSVVISDPNAVILSPGPLDSRACQVQNLHTAVCDLGPDDGSRGITESFDLGDGTNRLRVGAPSDALDLVVSASGYGDDVDTTGAGTANIAESGTFASLSLGQPTLDGTIILHGLASGDRVNTRQGTPRDTVDCDQGTQPARILVDIGDYILGPCQHVKAR